MMIMTMIMMITVTVMTMNANGDKNREEPLIALSNSPRWIWHCAARSRSLYSECFG